MDPVLTITYPPDGHETYEDHTFLVGSAPSGYEVQVNHTPIPVSAKGYFSWQIPLSPGNNRVVVTALKNKSDKHPAEKIITVHVPAPISLPRRPLQVFPQLSAPHGPMARQPGDTLPLRVVATPNATVTVRIPGLVETPVSLTPAGPSGTWWDNRDGIFAELHQTGPKISADNVYHGVLTLPRIEKTLHDAPLEVTVQQGEEHATVTLPATFSLWQGARLARVTKENAILRTAPPDGARLTPQQAGTLLAVDGLEGGWLRVKLTPHHHAWIAHEDVSLTDTAPPPETVLHLVDVRYEAPARKAVLSFPLARPVPLHLEAHPDKLLLTLFQTVSHCDFVRLDADDPRVEQVLPRSLEDGATQVEVRLRRPLAGVDYYWTAEGLELSLKTLPATPAKTVVLLDPGHGGPETGATTPSGIPEKTLNLAVSQKMADALKQVGFQVRLTRETDREVSLEDRAAQVSQTPPEADIVLSLHHNALPDGRNPQAVEGLSCYYYHPFARPLAEHLQKSLISALQLPDYGLLYDSLAMTRIPTAMAVLVEVGFFTNPTEFERLEDPAFQEKFAQAMANALRQFVSP